MKREEIETHWNEVLEVITKVEAMNEHLVVLGDANRLVGDLIPGSNPKVSFGGSLLRNLLENDHYILVNSSAKAVGGPWTREDPAHADSKSALDLVIISAELEKYLDKMVIDSERKFTAFKQIKGKMNGIADCFSRLCFSKLDQGYIENQFVPTLNSV